LVTAVFNHGIGRLCSENSKQHGYSPILKITINALSFIIGYASRVIYVVMVVAIN